MFSCEFYKISKNFFLFRALLVAASIISRAPKVPKMVEKTLTTPKYILSDASLQNKYCYFIGEFFCFILLFIIKFIFLSFSLLFLMKYSIKFLQQNINQSETGISESNSMKPTRKTTISGMATSIKIY